MQPHVTAITCDHLLMQPLAATCYCNYLRPPTCTPLLQPFSANWYDNHSLSRVAVTTCCCSRLCSRWLQLSCHQYRLGINNKEATCGHLLM
ncbi:unnamed protein product [Brugia timori]|uniref:Secreted protein n=1 Tax=Brugia timori TaxID=42155 RepID=A0A0R3RCK5_9BILA|nr:unnamed protein product [Brugia timori]